MSSTIAQIERRYLRQLQSFSGVHPIAAGNFDDLPEILSNFNNNDLLVCVHHQKVQIGWPSAIMKAGMNNLRYEELKQKLGADSIINLY